MKIETSRFGIIEIDEEKILTLKHGLLGFPDAKRFTIFQHRDDSPYYWMQSVDNPELAFVVIHPSVFCADYSFEIEDNIMQELDITRREQVELFVIVTVRKPSADSEEVKVSANLLGPVIINTENMTGMQIVLDPGKYPVQFDIPLI